MTFIVVIAAIVGLACRVFKLPHGDDLVTWLLLL